MEFLPTLVWRRRRRRLLLLLLLLVSLLLLLTFIFPNLQICFRWGAFVHGVYSSPRASFMFFETFCKLVVGYVCMDETILCWICCWKLVFGYVYMDMLDFVELCCWIWWNMLLDMLLDMLDMYACISVFETMSN